MKVKYMVSNDKRASHLNSIITDKYKQLITEDSPELLLVIGGDGAILHAIQDYNHMQVPFFGYANGTLNFLMNKADDFSEVIEDLLNDKVNLDYLETMSIKVMVSTNGKERFIGYAVNEVILGTYIMGYHHFLLSSSDNSFDNFEIKGSGISVCTDLGSTGYNFNLGGSILPIGSNLWSVNGIVCDRFLEDIINIQNLEIRLAENSRPANLFLDGVKKELTLDENSRVILSRGEMIKISFLDKEDFFKRRLEIISRHRK